MNVMAAALTGFGSWVGDIAERLIRGQIDEADALAELRQRYEDAGREIATAQAAMMTSRAKIDAEIAKLPHAPTGPVMPVASAPAGQPPMGSVGDSRPGSGNA